jgi:hypothetical protein
MEEDDDDDDDDDDRVYSVPNKIIVLNITSSLES